MPYTKRKTKKGYTVSSPRGVKGRGMTLRNAKSQIRLLNAVEHSDWRPRKRFQTKLPVHRRRGRRTPQRVPRKISRRYY